MEILAFLAIALVILTPIWVIALSVIVWRLRSQIKDMEPPGRDESLEHRLNHLENSIKWLRQNLEDLKSSDPASSSSTSQDSSTTREAPPDIASSSSSTPDPQPEPPSETSTVTSPSNWMVSDATLTTSGTQELLPERMVPAGKGVSKNETAVPSTDKTVEEAISETSGPDDRSGEIGKGAQKAEKNATASQPETTESDVPWEQYLGKRILPKVGAVILLVGILFFVQLAFQHMSNLARLSVVTAAGATLVGIGEYLRQSSRYERFIPPVIAAGWSILYFSAFASHGVEQTRVVESPLTAFVAMLCVAALFVGYTIRRSYRWMAAYAVVLSYGSLFLHLFLFGDTSLMDMFYTLSAVCLLNGGVVVLYTTIRSEYVMLCGMGMSYLFFLILLGETQHIGANVSWFLPLAPSTCLLSALGLSWMVMQVPTYVQADAGRVTHVISALNNTLFPLAFSLHLNAYDPGHLSSFFFVMGPVMIGHVLLEEYRENDLLGWMYLLFSTVVIGVGIWFASEGYDRSFWWLMEASALLGLGTVLRRSDVLDLGFATYLPAGIWLLGTAIDQSHAPFMLFESPIASGQLLYFLAAVFGYSVRSIQRILKTKPNRKWYTATAGWMGSLFVWTGVWYTLPITTISLGWAVYGIVLLELAHAQEDGMLSLQSNLFLLTAAGYLFVVDFQQAQLLGLPLQAVAFAVVGGMTAYAWWVMENDPLDEVMEWGQRTYIKELLGIAATGLFAMLIWNESVRVARTPLLAGLFMVLFGVRESGYDNTLWIPEIGMFAGTITDAVALGLMQERHPSLHAAYRGLALITPALLFIAASVVRSNRFANTLEEDRADSVDWGARWPFLLSFGSAFLVGYTCYVELSPDVLTVAWGVTGMLYLIPGMYLRKSMLRYPGLLMLGICIGKIAFVDLPELELVYRILSFIGLGVVLIFASFLYFYFDRMLSDDE